MGAATSITSGGWFFAEAVDVVLVLNDARNIALLEREEPLALVHLNPDDSGRFILTRESPASLSLTSTKIVVIEFQGIIQGQQDCCAIWDHFWLPLQPASALLREDDHIDHFEKARERESSRLAAERRQRPGERRRGVETVGSIK
eukprot:g28717.t1